METYEVNWTTARGVRRAKYASVQSAVIFAREKAIDHTGWAGRVVTVWDGRGVVIALVTDDANGLTVHRLATWPAGVESSYV